MKRDKKRSPRPKMIKKWTSLKIHDMNSTKWRIVKQNRNILENIEHFYMYVCNNFLQSHILRRCMRKHRNIQLASRGILISFLTFNPSEFWFWYTPFFVRILILIHTPFFVRILIYTPFFVRILIYISFFVRILIYISFFVRILILLHPLFL